MYDYVWFVIIINKRLKRVIFYCYYYYYEKNAISQVRSFTSVQIIEDFLYLG